MLRDTRGTIPNLQKLHKHNFPTFPASSFAADWNSPLPSLLSPIVHVLPQHRHVRAPWNVRKTSSFCRRRRRPRNSPLLFELLVSLFPAKLSQQTKKEWQVDLWRKIPVWRRFSPCWIGGCEMRFHRSYMSTQSESLARGKAEDRMWNRQICNLALQTHFRKAEILDLNSTYLGRD